MLCRKKIITAVFLSVRAYGDVIYRLINVNNGSERFHKLQNNETICFVWILSNMSDTKWLVYKARCFAEVHSPQKYGSWLLSVQHSDGPKGKFGQREIFFH